MTRARTVRAGAGLLTVLLLGGCGLGGGAGTGSGGSAPPRVAPGSGGLRIQEVARLSSPVAMATRAGDAALYVADFSFDASTGDLWIADVGQYAWEEIDRQPGGSRGGQNYGWNRLEGTHPYKVAAPAGSVPPVLEYSHDDGSCTVIGGYVYRGSAVPALRGAYVYGDYCAGWIAAVSLRNGTVGQPSRLPFRVPNLSSFGLDQAGELYVMSTDGPLYRFVAG